MDRKKVIVLFVLVILMGVFFVAIIMNQSKIDIASVQGGSVIYKTEEVELSKDDFFKIKAYINGKVLYDDFPSCGFLENVVIKLDNGDLLLLALDGCPIIYYPKEEKYISFTEEEMVGIHTMLGKYGMVLPAV